MVEWGLRAALPGGIHARGVAVDAAAERGCGEGRFGEKEFNDKVLRSGMMPIELMRALLLGVDLTKEYKPEWKFYKPS